VYLVDRTIPMLPERLSNHLCSLVPHEDRLTFGAVFEITDKGKVKSEWFGRTIIHSDHRFSYEDAQAVIDAGIGAHAQELIMLNTIAHALRKERFAQGSVGFETDEVKFRLDENFKPIAVYRKTRFDAHKLIEDFMLLANRRVARYVAKMRKKPQELPFVYRIHATPSQEKLTALKNFVATFGYKLDTEDESKVSQSLNKLVTDSVGKPEENLIQTIAIRSMPKAVYTTHNVGHYGLGFEYYTHFTSPIRRYPDVLVHRLLARYLESPVTADADALEAMCKHSSEREKRAADAERASVKFKQVEFLEGMLGQTADGIVSGVTDWGIYVELLDNKCEGMVPLRELRDDHYELDEKNYQLIGRRSRKTIRLGDKVRVQVKKTNLVKRIADFKMVEKLS
jgi:ribonuclease R